MSYGSRVVRVSLALAIPFCVSGCSNPSEEADLSKVTDSMRSSLPVVSGDIAGTCERRGKLLANIPDEEKSPTDSLRTVLPFTRSLKK